MTNSYVPSSDACLAFLEAAVTPTTDGKVPHLAIGAGLQAAVAVDGADLLRYLLGVLLSTRAEYKIQVALSSADLLDLMGLKSEAPILTAGETH